MASFVSKLCLTSFTAAAVQRITALTLNWCAARHSSDAAVVVQRITALTQLLLRSASQLWRSCCCAARHSSDAAAAAQHVTALMLLLLRSASQPWRCCCCAAHHSYDSTATAQRAKILTQLLLSSTSKLWRSCCSTSFPASAWHHYLLTLLLYSMSLVLSLSSPQVQVCCGVLP